MHRRIGAYDVAMEYAKEMELKVEKNAKRLEALEKANSNKVFPWMRTIHKDGDHEGDVELSHFEVSAQDSGMTKVRALLNPGVRWFSYVPPGKYVRLIERDGDGTLWMTDTAHERLSSLPLVENAHGHVLISGLGLGMVLPPVLQKKSVTQVTVLEKSCDIIKLVGKRFTHPKLTILEEDVFFYKPPADSPRYDVVFHDIWPHVCDGNLPQMTVLKRRFVHWMNKKNPRRWQGCWAEGTCRDLRKERCEWQGD